ncbi:MAG: hypothetical protein RL685_2198 [Pseudomonadota bacterium]|jgi:hypothetical protein
MTLARRLARLQAMPARGVTATAPPALQESPATLSVDARQRVEQLRQQLQTLFAGERPLSAASAPAAVRGRPRMSLAQLPFVRRETRAGPLWQRNETLTGGHRIGTVPLERLAAADPAVLAELALDPRVAGAAPSGWLFLDTETTGLSGAGTLAFLVGMAGLDGRRGAELEQLLLREPGQERPLLERVLERFHAATLIISFNGKAFDRPLLEGRLVMNRLPRLPERPHLDLLHVARRLHRERLGRCTLKRLESRVLGFDRGPDIEGSEVAAIYGHFLRSEDAAGISAVVAHNLWDVASMLALVGLYGQRLPPLAGQDLAGLARTLLRAGALQEAERTAQAACEGGGGVDALRVRAELAKVRGDSLAAIRDLELVCLEVDDPAGRLELAKLYEHRMRHPARALEWLERGTTESEIDDARRRARLARKLSLC